jgi:hypothetical protein
LFRRRDLARCTRRHRRDRRLRQPLGLPVCRSAVSPFSNGLDRASRNPDQALERLRDKIGRHCVRENGVGRIQRALARPACVHRLGQGQA